MPRSRFSTLIKKYSIQAEPLAFPISFGPKQLNATIKKLLKDNDVDTQNVNFNFFIKGQVLTEPLNDFIKNNDISEEIEEISYDIEVQPPNLEGEIKTEEKILSLKFNSKWILVASFDIQIFDVASLEKPVIFIEMEDAIQAVDWLSLNEETSEGVFVAGSISGRVSIWRCNLKNFTATEICQLKGPKENIACLAVSTDLSLVASGTKNGSLTIWSTDISEAVVAKDTPNAIPSKTPLIQMTEAHKFSINAIRWFSDSNTTGNLITCGVDGMMKQWSVNTTCENVSIEDTTWPVLCLDVNHDNKTIVVGSNNSRLKVYSLSNNPKQIQNIFGVHQCAIHAIKWSPINSNQFVTGGHDCLIKLWDIRNLKTPLLQLPTAKGLVLALDWSADGQWLVASYMDHTLRLYRFNQ